jgi:hypothetical protein
MGLCERFCKLSLFLLASNFRSRLGVVLASFSGGVGAGEGNPKIRVSLNNLHGKYLKGAAHN